MNTRDYVKKRFGIDVVEREQPLNTQVQITATPILANNGGRLAYVIVNLGATALYVGFTPAVSTTNGMYVPANGGSIQITSEEDFTLPIKQVWGISTGVVNIYVLELLIGGGENAR